MEGEGGGEDTPGGGGGGCEEGDRRGVGGGQGGRRDGGGVVGVVCGRGDEGEVGGRRGEAGGVPRPGLRRVSEVRWQLWRVGGLLRAAHFQVHLLCPASSLNYTSCTMGPSRPAHQNTVFHISSFAALKTSMHCAAATSIVAKP